MLLRLLVHLALLDASTIDLSMVSQENPGKPTYTATGVLCEWGVVSMAGEPHETVLIGPEATEVARLVYEGV